MTDPFDFEPRLEARLNAHAARAARPFDAAAIAAAATGVARPAVVRPWTRLWSGDDGRLSPLRAAVVLLLLAVVLSAGTVLVGAVLRGQPPRPDRLVVVPPTVAPTRAAQTPPASTPVPTLESAAPVSSRLLYTDEGRGRCGTRVHSIDVLTGATSEPFAGCFLGLSIAPDGRHLIAGGGTGHDTGDGVGFVDPANQNRYTLVDLRSGAETPFDTAGTGRLGWSPDGRWLLRDNTVSSVDGLSPTALPNNDGTGCALCWSPDGSYLAIHTAKGLMIGDGSGAGMHVVPTIPGISSWLKDGHRIAFVQNGDAWVADVDGSNVRNATNFESGGADSAQLSPDGRALAVIQGHKTLWLIDGSGARRSVDLSADLTDQGSEVVWSPNGQWLAVVPQYDGHRTPQTILVSIDGAVITRVNAANLSRATGFDYEPRLRAWSPDGSRIAIWTSPWEDPSAATTGTTDRLGTTYLLAADGSTLKLENAWSVAWAPDGRSFAVLGGKVTASRIDIIDSDGSHRHTVSTGPISSPGDPTWVP